MGALCDCLFMFLASVISFCEINFCIYTGTTLFIAGVLHGVPFVWRECTSPPFIAINNACDK